ncbi:hypothetical protein [Neobacillus mesonae]|nr:hypothetical protein [Neobacillus mesonae]MCM3568186.1 hypothetical protein [Neobacillus mesonae]
MKKLAVLLVSISLVFIFTTNKGVEAPKTTDTAAVNSVQSIPILPPVG